jgi:hypothetical protein
MTTLGSPHFEMWGIIGPADTAGDQSVLHECAKTNCTTSTFDIHNVLYAGMSGTIVFSYIAEFQCSRSQNGCDVSAWTTLN